MGLLKAGVLKHWLLNWGLLKIIFILVIILATLSVARGISISEVMYNPVGNDNNHEFVEVYGTGNLSGYSVGDSASNDSLQLLHYENGNISLIVESGFNFSSLIGKNCSVYSAGSTIGNNLDNSGDSVFIYFNNSAVDSFSYNGSLGNGNGKSLEKINGSVRESFSDGGSPCEKNRVASAPGGNNSGNMQGNNVTKDIELSIILDKNVFVDRNYTSIFKLLNKDNVVGEDDNVSVLVEYNVSFNGSVVYESNFTRVFDYSSGSGNGNVVFHEEGGYTLCGEIKQSNYYDDDLSNNKVCGEVNASDVKKYSCKPFLYVESDKEEYNNSEKIGYWIKTNFSKEILGKFVISYWIEDNFGEPVTGKKNTSNFNKKSYTPSLKEREKTLVIRGEIVKADCALVKSSAYKKVHVFNNLGDGGRVKIKRVLHGCRKEECFFNGLDVFREGETVKVEGEFYSGKEGGSVSAFLEKRGKRIFESAPVEINRGYLNLSSALSFKIEGSCEEDFEEGKYSLVVEGFGDRDEREVYVFKDGCLNEESRGKSGGGLEGEEERRKETKGEDKKGGEKERSVVSRENGKEKEEESAKNSITSITGKFFEQLPKQRKGAGLLVIVFGIIIMGIFRGVKRYIYKKSSRSRDYGAKR